jgi:ferrous iron transport protein B
VWGIGLAYGLAVLYYQFANFTAHPTQSLMWLGVIAAALIAAIWALRQNGVRHAQSSAT